MTLLAPRKRLLLAAVGVGVMASAASLVLLGFALSAWWPGVSWAVGASLGLVAALIGARCIWAAATGRHWRDAQTPIQHRGTL